MNWGTDMDDKDTDDQMLDALFAAGKAEAPQASDAFLAQLATDADAALPKAQRRAREQPSSASFYQRFKGIFAASGLSGAAALGVWIGFVMPELVTTVSPLTEDTAALTSFLPGADLSVLSE